MNIDEARLVLGALDTFGVVLADHGHCWTEGERAIYEESAIILANIIDPTEMEPDYEI